MSKLSPVFYLFRNFMRLFTLIFVAFMLSNLSFGQEIIYIREGFPYCESFETLMPRANTVINGSKRVGKNDEPAIPVLTGTSLQLTTNSPEESGYVYIDYPFASNRGVKVSFEYSSYGKTTVEGADGLSFFMFDGSIDPSNFEIGGKGGALGYTARKAVNGGKLEEDEPGLKGAYLGIGLDEFGNFGNYFENKRYGFLGKNTVPISTLSSPGSALDRFPHSIVLRGPVMANDFTRNDAITFESYEFITGRILNENVFLGVDPKYMSPSNETLFKVDISSSLAVFDCNDIGYRKVFIDLQPDPISGFYKVNVWMLINETGVRELIHVIVNEPYPFIPPPFLKIGFAASTGGSNNFHNIKNVTVEVSDLSTVSDPIGPSYSREVCQGGELEFEINPQVDNEAFVRCIQLFEDLASANAAKSAAEANNSSQNFDCGLSGTCFYELCNPDNLIIDTNFGSFETFMVEVSNGVFQQKIRYESNGVLSSTGEVTVYYTVVDNFGQMSEPKPITVEVIPNPEPTITTVDPLVWEPGEVNNIRVRFEVEPKGQGYTYQWYKDGVAISGAVSDSYLALGPGAIGAYTVEVTTDKGCFGASAQEVKIRLVENLNPQLPDDAEKRETCDALGSIKVVLDGNEITGIDDNGNSGNEKYRIVSLPSNAVVVDWQFLTPGQSTVEVSNLPIGSYEFQIGDQFRSGQPGSDGSPLFRHQIPFEILPIEFPLQLAVSTEQPLCFQGNGSVLVNTQGGNGQYTYELIQGSTILAKSPDNIPQINYTFSSVPVGNYEVRVTSGSRCEEIETISLASPSPVSLNVLEFKDVTCEVNDAFVKWEASGGIGPYSFVSLKRDGILVPQNEFVLIQTNNLFFIDGLTEGNYTLEILDSNGCNVFSSADRLIKELPKPSISITNDTNYCENVGNVLLVTTLTNSSAISNPAYTWISPNGDRISVDTEINGVTYSVIDHDNNLFTPPYLSISGLSEGDFLFTIEIRGEETCDQDFSTSFKINPQPEPEILKVDPVSCFGGQDGLIEVGVLNGAVADFEFMLDGITQYQDSPLFNQNIAAGDYLIFVRNKISGCVNSIMATVDGPSALEIKELAKINPFCGLENGSFEFEISGGVEDYVVLINNKPLADYSFSLVGNVYEISNLSPGTYSISVTDANSCSLNLPNFLSLIDDPGLQVNMKPISEEICFGQDAMLKPEFAPALPATTQFKWFKDANLTSQISTSSIPDEDGLTYQFDETNGILIVENLKEGSSQFFLEISGPGICGVVEVADVEVFPEISALFDIKDVTCFGSASGEVIIDPSGGNGKFEISLNGAAFSENLVYTNLLAGEYQIDIRNSIGCTKSYKIQIEGPLNPISINTPSIERASCDLDNGSIRDLIISGGWGSYTVEWRKGSLTGPLVPGTITEALNLGPDTYYLIVTDLEGCIETFDFKIEESSDPVYQLVPPIDNCFGTPVVIRPIHLAPDPSLPPAAATEVRWYSGPGQTGLIQNGPDPTNPNVIYTIDDSDWLNPELIVEGLPAGDYDYYFYVVCTGQELKVEITVFDTPAVVLSTDPVICFGDSNGKITVSNDLPVYSYSLNSGAPISKTQLEALNLPAGNYSLEVNTSGGCPQSISFVIDGPQAPLTSSTLKKNDPSCGAPNGKLELTVTGGWLPYSLEVFKDGISQGTQDFSQPNILLDGYRPGQYYIVVTDKEGCSLTTNTIIMVDGPTQILIDEENICFGESTVLTPKINPVAPGAVFEWFFDLAKSKPIISSSTPASDGMIYLVDPATGQLTITNLPASPTKYAYYVTASGPGVCPGFIGTGEVKVFEIPAATVSVENEICFQAGGKLTVNASGGSGVFTYSLNGGAFGNSNVFQVPSGTHSVEVRTSEGCSFVVNNILVTGPAGAMIVENIQQDNPSCNTANGEVRFDVRGGYEPYSIGVIQNGSLIRTLALAATGQIIIPDLLAGVYNFEITDDQGCVLLIPGSLNLEDVPSVITAADDVICEGETAVLTPSLPQNISNPVYSWSFDAAGNNLIPAGVVNNVTYTISAKGELSIQGLVPANSPYTYYIIASGPGICGIEPKAVKVFVNAIPTLRVSNPSVVCDPNGTVDLTDYIEGFNPSVYDYNVVSPNGAAMRLDEIDNVNLSGDYRVNSSLKGTGCWNQIQRIKVLIAELELMANFEYEFDFGDGVLFSNTIVQIQEDVFFKDLSVGNVIIWNWDFGDGISSSLQNPVHQFQEKGVYTVTLTTIDDIGCISTYQVLIMVNADFNVMIPSAFTPDGLKNKYFRPYYRGISSMEFYIFNTWGELIYKSDSLEDLGWDGFLNGKPAINGNYVYRGIFNARTGEKIEKTGVFILIR